MGGKPGEGFTNIEMLENMISVFSFEKRVKVCKNLYSDGTASESVELDKKYCKTNNLSIMVKI